MGFNGPSIKQILGFQLFIRPNKIESEALLFAVGSAGKSPLGFAFHLFVLLPTLPLPSGDCGINQS